MPSFEEFFWACQSGYEKKVAELLHSSRDSLNLEQQDPKVCHFISFSNYVLLPNSFFSLDKLLSMSLPSMVIQTF